MSDETAPKRDIVKSMANALGLNLGPRDWSTDLTEPTNTYNELLDLGGAIKHWNDKDAS